MQIFVGSLLVALSGFLFWSSANPIAVSDARNRSLMMEAHRLELSLENEFFRNKDFSRNTFEQLEAVDAKIHLMCNRMIDPKQDIAGKLSARVDADIHLYCDTMFKKLILMEQFKTSQVRLRDLMHENKMDPTKVSANASEIEARKAFVESVTENILHQKTGNMLTDIFVHYDQAFQAKQEKSQIWQILAVVLGTVFSLVTLWGVVELWRQFFAGSKEKLYTMGEIAGYLAHEINNPLTLALFKVQQLESKLNKDGDLNRQELTKDLIQLRLATVQIHKISKGIGSLSVGQDAYLQQVDLDILLDQVLDILRAKFEKYSVKFEYRNICKRSMNLECRPSEISQLLLHLLYGAFESVRNTQNPKIELQISDGLHGYQIKIKHSAQDFPLHLNYCNQVISAHHGKFLREVSKKENQKTIFLPRQQSENTSLAS